MRNLRLIIKTDAFDRPKRDPAMSDDECVSGLRKSSEEHDSADLDELRG